MGGLRVGCQGWRYPDWRRTGPLLDELAAPFYPQGLPESEELTHYSRCFNLVEVDATFYAIPSAKVVEQWRDATPEDFCFTLKLPRTLTHEARLQRGRQTLSDFCQIAELLGPKLAAILIQLPPSFGPKERPVLERFLGHLPKTLPFALEFRDRTWLTSDTIELLSRYQVALTLGATPWITTADSLPWLEQLPTDWLYLRFMGIKVGGITQFTHLQADHTEELQQWAKSIQNRRGYVLMDNHYQGFSPGTVALFLRELGLTAPIFPRDQEPQQLRLL